MAVADKILEALSGRRILFAGCTGFVGKVALSMEIPDKCPEISGDFLKLNRNF